MSLLALMADKFELEEHPDADAGGRSIVVEHDGGIGTSLLGDDSPHGKYAVHHEAGEGARSEHDFKTDAMSISPDDKEDTDGAGAAADDNGKEETKLLITFLLMVVVGTANKVFQKLQAIPMYNYPNSLNLLQNFVYVPLCFAYILPVSRFGLLNNAIPAEVTTMSKKPFVIMGLFDCITCILLTFAAVYLPGSLLILLPQAAIPISMMLSKKIKGERYAKYQYLGAAVVVLGILVVLEPLITQRHAADFVCEAYDEDEFCALCGEEATEEGCLSHRTKGLGARWVVPSWREEGDQVILRSLAQSNTSDAATVDDHVCRWIMSDAAQPSSSGTTTTLIWSVVTILACIPMTLSSIYKEMSLSGSQSNIDPIFLNGWVALFQLFFSFPLSIPAGMTSSPPITPQELPKNIWDGIKCYLGSGTITSGCHPDDQCHEAPLYVNVFLVFNVCFNILIVYILKFGSANVLFMASTVMVPIGNLAFALPFMPGSQPLEDSDVAGLLVILSGLVTYRFGNAVNWRAIPPLPLRLRKERRRPGILSEDDFTWDTPVYEDENESHSSRLQEPLLTPVRSGRPL